MAQSRLGSVLEAVAGNAIAFIIGVVANIVVLPLFGCHVDTSQSIMITAIFSAISLVRTYLVRRMFNWFEQQFAVLRTLT